MREYKVDDQILHVPYPQYPGSLARMKGRLQYIDGTFRIQKEFLYKAERNFESELDNSFSGRGLFEYVPNLNGRRYGRLIMEDGGQDKVGVKEFDFGPAS
jgi:hypothetical protein